MNDKYIQDLAELEQTGNYRKIPKIEDNSKLMDLSSNDYLGLSTSSELKKEFFSKFDYNDFEFSSVASRLLSRNQKDFIELENLLAGLYNKSALLFNSGYHANTGILPAICDANTLILADKLIHASIIDGIKLSKAHFERYRHNDYHHLEALLEKNHSQYNTIIIVTESIFSMDGDKCDLHRLVGYKQLYNNIMLYIDEAHAFGVLGKQGLGYAEECNLINDIDIIVGTLGKAAASSGAFVITSETLKQYLINKSRSFIFSTAIAPICCKWSTFIISKIINMQQERIHLKEISDYVNNYIKELNQTIHSSSQIIPLVIGDSALTVKYSQKLHELGYSALAIRTPTVPAKTERIRFSLNAKLTWEQIYDLVSTLKSIL